jgi:hypothetical protein
VSSLNLPIISCLSARVSVVARLDELVLVEEGDLVSPAVLAEGALIFRAVLAEDDFLMPFLLFVFERDPASTEYLREGDLLKLPSLFGPLA